MKKFLLGAVGLVALGMATPAVAADMRAPPPMKAAPMMVEPMYNWSGFYIGINGGWASSYNSHYWSGPNGVAGLGYSNDASGGTIGGQMGYNWQAGSWVFGLEAQGNWLDLDRSYHSPVANTWSTGSRVDALGLFTGRIGYAANNALFYVKGGAAVASNDHWYAWNDANWNTASTSRWGAAVGAGLEYGFAPNWSIGFEYMHAWLGDSDYRWNDTRLSGWNNHNVEQDIDLFTVRLNYRFGGVGKGPVGKAPVTARY